MNDFRFEHPRTVLSRYGLAAKKSWGQNFLVSEKAVRTIALECAAQNTPILEIGGGLGTLTQGLLHFSSGQVTVLERDRDMCAVLLKEFSDYPGFSLIEGDAAKFDYQDWLKTNGGTIAGNLPYQITGAILKQVMQASQYMDNAVFMVQLEVADRLCAPVSDANRGAISVMLSARCHIKTILRLKPTAFFPPPKVRSAVVRLTPRDDNPLQNVSADMFDKVVKAAFSTRRKTLRNSLSDTLCSREDTERLLKDAEVSPTIRAQDLDITQFVQLTHAAQKYPLL
ncbi:MAG: ribosomal RNA small subunit methyltransferase A [Deltaproteobacteria bacterium]|nr:ribosomal RNA small subunit methyltransferase A [Deltaproteobacteria bacterium]